MKVSSRDRGLLVVVALVALVAGFYMLVLKPERRTAAHLQTQIAAARATLTSAQQREADGHAAEVFLRRTQGDWTAAQRAVPKVSDIPGLLRLLQRSAESAHVSMQSISLAGSGASGTGSSASSGTSHGATTIPVALTFSGGYQALNRLVHHLDSLVAVSHGRLDGPGPLIGISEVDLSPAGSGSQLSVQLTATIYQHSSASTVLGASQEVAG